RTERLGLFALRALFTCGAMLTWFYAVSVVPIADVTALSFVAPIFATIGAALFLRETVRARRWTATAVGFLGAMIILRPGLVELTPGHWAALASAGFGSITVLIIKSLSRTENPTKVVFYVGLFLIPVSAVLAFTVWETPAPEMWIWIALIGPVATFAHVTLVKAMSLADASAILPFDFARLPFAALLGWLAFGELSDAWTWVGAAVIFASGAYIGHREAQLGRRQSTAPHTNRL
ncbi:MAG: EamA family transporter, partial [Magnetovibrio sp.]|nr:EamA family transporter [Magnetovibrio sp.]